MNPKDFYKGTYGTMYYVKDMAKSVEYYKKLGLAVRMESPDWVEFEANGQALCLHKAEAKQTLPGGIMIFHVKKLAGLVEELKMKGVRFNGEPHNVHEKNYSIDCQDLDGNRLSFYGTLD